MSSSISWWLLTKFTRCKYCIGLTLIGMLYSWMNKDTGLIVGLDNTVKVLGYIIQISHQLKVTLFFSCIF